MSKSDAPASEKAAQRSLSVGVAEFAAAAERTPGLLEFQPSERLTQTEIIVAVSALMRWAQLETFELAVWRAFGEGRR